MFGNHSDLLAGLLLSRMLLTVPRHSRFEKRTINRYGLLYTLKGSDSSLKPLLLTAHQDVVPAGLASSWTYPPFSGYYDGAFVWGRGSTDCKNVLVGLLSAIEDLLEQSFSPRRTIVLAFGFDEETGGTRGAKELGKALLDQWGSNSFILVLDEGGMGVQTVGEVLYALPGVAEKGYHDVQLTLDVTGGHSSKPPPHTGIGIASAMVVALENSPYVPRLTQTNSFRRVLECKAKYSPDMMPSWLKDALRSGEEENIAKRLAEEEGDDRWLMQTSQAVDIISGGIKVNALPEQVQVTVNHRIAPHESIEFVNNHMENVLIPLAKHYGMKIIKPGDAYTSNLTAMGELGTLTIDYPQSLVVAPISPTNNTVWDLFGGTLRHVFESTESANGRTVVPVGDIMTGNTDTQRYWDLTRNIYRYSPAREGTRLNAHAIDERMEITSHVEGMRVYYGQLYFLCKTSECLLSWQILSAISTPGMQNERLSIMARPSSSAPHISHLSGVQKLLSSILRANFEYFLAYHTGFCSSHFG